MCKENLLHNHGRITTNEATKVSASVEKVGVLLRKLFIGLVYKKFLRIRDLASGFQDHQREL